MFLLYAIAGLGTGFLVGLTGMGGGAIMTPMLMLLFGISPRVAVGTDLWFASITKMAATGVGMDKGLIEWDIVFKLWYGSLTATLLTLLWLNYLDPSSHDADTAFIKQVIAAAILWAGMGLLFQPLVQMIAENYFDGGQAADVKGPMAWIITVISGAIIGALVTLTSVGAGALGTVVLLYLYPVRLTPRRLIATEIAHAIPLALLSGLGHMGLGNVNFSIMLPLLLGSIPGAIIGATLSAQLHPKVMKAILSFTLLSLGAKLWWMPKR